MASYDNVEVRGSDQGKRGAVAQAIIFAAYLASLTILAILAVNMWYFLILAVAGLPATGIIQAVEAHIERRNWNKQLAAEVAEMENQPIQVQRATTADGLPLIEL